MVFNRAPAERQVHACRILFESVEQRPTVDAESDPHAVRNEVALEHPVAPQALPPIEFGCEGCREIPWQSRTLMLATEYLRQFPSRYATEYP